MQVRGEAFNSQRLKKLSKHKGATMMSINEEFPCHKNFLFLRDESITKRTGRSNCMQLRHKISKEPEKSLSLSYNEHAELEKKCILYVEFHSLTILSVES